MLHPLYVSDPTVSGFNRPSTAERKREGEVWVDRQHHWVGALPPTAIHSSKRERNAVDAEREYFDVQKVRLMESRIGDSFTGVISSVTNFGFFVVLNEFFVEGLVH